eukprot:2411648-Pleurochrysis_carterae.AAC.1
MHHKRVQQLYRVRNGCSEGMRACTAFQRGTGRQARAAARTRCWGDGTGLGGGGRPGDGGGLCGTGGSGGGDGGGAGAGGELGGGGTAHAAAHSPGGEPFSAHEAWHCANWALAHRLGQLVPAATAAQSTVPESAQAHSAPPVHCEPSMHANVLPNWPTQRLLYAAPALQHVSTGVAGGRGGGGGEDGGEGGDGGELGGGGSAQCATHPPGAKLFAAHEAWHSDHDCCSEQIDCQEDAAARAAHVDELSWHAQSALEVQMPDFSQARFVCAWQAVERADSERQHWVAIYCAGKTTLQEDFFSPPGAERSGASDDQLEALGLRTQPVEAAALTPHRGLHCNRVCGAPCATSAHARP